MIGFIAVSMLKLLVPKKVNLTQTNWPAHLKEFLNKPQSTFQYHNLLSKLAKSNGFTALSFEEKIVILDYIFECLLQIDEIRAEMEEHANQARNLLKEKRALELTISRLKKKKPAKEITEENNETKKDGEEEEEEEDEDEEEEEEEESEEEMDVEKLQKQSDRMNEDFDKKMEALILRCEPLGQDRFFNKYYWFGNQDYLRSFNAIPTPYRILPSSACRVYVQMHKPNVVETSQWTPKIEEISPYYQEKTRRR
jgi:hypothetical protein